MKLILIAYIVRDGFTNDLSLVLIIGFMLSFIISSFGRKFIKKQFRIIVCIFEVGLSAYFAIHYIPCAIFICSVALMEYLIVERNLVLLGSIGAFIPLFFNNVQNISQEQILITLLLIITIVCNHRNTIKILNLREDDEIKRNLIHSLERKLIQEKEVHGQDLYTARLEERNKISGRLHDKLGHTISAVLLQLEAVKFIINMDNKKGNEMLDSSIETLRSGMDDIRMTLRNIRPAQEELGINRIKLILEEKTKNTNINFKLSYNGDLDNISASTWLLFINSVMELSTNSIKYARCNLIEVKIDILRKIIKLEVKDNGNGTAKFKKGIGLSNIEDKVTSAGGKLIINSDNGFSTILLIPY
ncbi:sensor histidine kinase [Inconstantimicrobium mannanitabidum]|uniref:Two-component sensor histidine kinase n=1 Tax=Inconstantimicrobium mannanitabidum TaxID=1604901 RepID=A0ACB5REL8_9CLOT|nr:histidine kinase [Clostridium sp. TW13]GKX67219.1 two-component sensor histidine kinase [Clostridium sp. TW13]